ncbi:MAG TPA: ATP-binding protein [Burkholderiaceae bacterium]|nr:ATP-binding protein [Burkholderiaceae bacterium]
MEATRGFVIALVGAESTGKTTLAGALAERLRAETGHGVAVVGEVLREWCEQAGRTPRIEEQAAIVAEQRRRIDAAAGSHAIVVADTTPLMIAVYHRIVFNDRSLDEPAGRWHAARVDHTLVTALDLPWVADGHQRDGEHVRAPVDAALRELLAAHCIAWSRVAGVGQARVESALDAVAPLLRRRPSPRRGLFTRLAERDAAQPDWPWLCDCDLPDCEHRLRATDPR